ncbi:MAG: DUF992 domain-containing protein [Pseudomonadota bacterium]
MNIVKTAILSLTLGLASLSSLVQAQERIELGNLECFVDEGSGFIIGSTKDISCVFYPLDDTKPEQNYFGVISKYGLDIGTTEQAYLTWLVVAPTNAQLGPGFLAGDYFGASASASFAVGLGANVLVGGSSQTFALQPLSVGTQVGFNIAAGIAEIELRSIN